MGEDTPVPDWRRAAQNQDGRIWNYLRAERRLTAPGPRRHVLLLVDRKGDTRGPPTSSASPWTASRRLCSASTDCSRPGCHRAAERRMSPQVLRCSCRNRRAIAKGGARPDRQLYAAETTMEIIHRPARPQSTLRSQPTRGAPRLGRADRAQVSRKTKLAAAFRYMRAAGRR